MQLLSNLLQQFLVFAILLVFDFFFFYIQMKYRMYVLFTIKFCFSGYCCAGDRKAGGPHRTSVTTVCWPRYSVRL